MAGAAPPMAAVPLPGAGAGVAGVEGAGVAGAELDVSEVI
jgi:hypothetical protein